MNQIKLYVAAAFILLQCVFFVVWAGFEQMRLAPGVGDSIVVPIRPVDPRDLLRGQYMRLGYEFGRIPNRDIGEGQDVWVLMRLDPDSGQHNPVEYSSTRSFSAAHQPQDVVIRGRVVHGRAEFGIDKYYVPEGTPTPNMRDLTVRLRIGGDHRPRIETVYLKGVSWP